MCVCCPHSDAPGLCQVFHPGVGWTQRCSIHQRGGGVWPGGAGTPQGHQSELHEGAGTRGGHGTLAGEQRDELRLQRLHLQDHVLQEEATSDSRSVVENRIFSLLLAGVIPSTSTTAFTTINSSAALSHLIVHDCAFLSLKRGIFCNWLQPSP